jgi:hypothetical protein
VTDDPAIVDRSALQSAYNQVTFPGRYESQRDADRVQWAARRAVAALERLSLECEIVTHRNLAAQETRSANRAREMVSMLVKLRGAKR